MLKFTGYLTCKLKEWEGVKHEKIHIFLVGPKSVLRTPTWWCSWDISWWQIHGFVSYIFITTDPVRYLYYDLQKHFKRSKASKPKSLSIPLVIQSDLTWSVERQNQSQQDVLRHLRLRSFGQIFCLCSFGLLASLRGSPFKECRYCIWFIVNI